MCSEGQCCVSSDTNSERFKNFFEFFDTIWHLKIWIIECWCGKSLHTGIRNRSEKLLKQRGRRIPTHSLPHKKKMHLKKHPASHMGQGDSALVKRLLGMRIWVPSAPKQKSKKGGVHLLFYLWGTRNRKVSGASHSCQPSLWGLHPTERPCLKTQWTVPEKWLPRLTFSLYTHEHTCITLTHGCTCIHINRHTYRSVSRQGFSV